MAKDLGASGDGQSASTTELSAGECDALTQQFAAITDTDECCAHYFLQDTGWHLQTAINAYYQATQELKLDEERRDGEQAREQKESTSCTIRRIESKCKLTVLSWNIDGLSTKSLSPRTQAVVAEILQVNPDCVFLQEVVAASLLLLKEKLTKLVDILKLFMYQIIDTAAANPQLPYFTAVLLRKDVLKYEDHHVIPFERSSMGRTLLCVRACLNSIPIAFMCVHLESMRDFADERKRQIQFCFEQAVQSAKSDVAAVVLAGDFNVRDNELAEIGGVPLALQDVWESVGAPPDAKFTWDLKRNDNCVIAGGKATPRCRFDRMYVNRDEDGITRIECRSFRLIGQQRIRSCLCFPSDHFGCLAELEIKV